MRRICEFSNDEVVVIQIRRSALVPYVPDRMFDLVNDVEAYPQRFAWCDGAEVLEREEASLVARLDLKLAGFRQSFTTRNTAQRPERLHISLVSGPFRTLDGTWHFQPLGETGCKIILELDFDYAGRLGGTALRLGFQGLASRMVDDFSREAGRVYGR